MANVYVIVGETGAYDSFEQWNVGAFLDDVMCCDYLHELKEWLKEKDITDDTFEFAEKPLEDCPYDSKLLDYWRDTGVSYRMERLELLKVE